MLLISCAHCLAEGTIYQYSTIDSLLLGNYDGELSISQLLEHGDTGLGTFNSLDGEMIIIDGAVYRIDAKGKAEAVPAATHTPFAATAFFKTDSILKVDKTASLEELNRKVSQILGSENIFYIIRIDGQFESMRTRSVPAQKKPYPPLVEVVKHQGLFKFNKIKGTLIGIKSPGYIKGIGVAGFHWHFITEDRKAGGHVLDCSFENLPAKISSYSSLFLQLPETADFLNSDLSKDKEKELKKVEKNPGNS
ncbi:acetolactate decarboxylase [Maridesulfovibrio sp. FT414]|uniref:acetolactate decarboxylase n=1 Tax=Maridesulfovibrio sp. FT414 TaxID=2979469 RepID=UPI003D8030BB